MLIHRKSRQKNTDTSMYMYMYTYIQRSNNRWQDYKITNLTTSHDYMHKIQTVYIQSASHGTVEKTYPCQYQIQYTRHVYTHGKLPANQHDVIFLQVSINPTVQDECDMAAASFQEPRVWICVVHAPTRFCPSRSGCPSRAAILQVRSD